ADESGEVRFSFMKRSDDPGDQDKRARAAAEEVAGDTRVKVNVQLPQMAPQGRQGGLKPGSVPAPTPKPGILADVRLVVAVSSG
ncbi:MAG: hypothetical protein Q8N53_02280, partial [Longimicrobiales bacterium]|nr:hypothetical protein [Longimicrobiales bacterium]